MEETISLGEIFIIFKKRFAMLVLFTVVGMSISGMLTFFVITPKYSSQTQVIVSLAPSEAVNINDINANLQMINTYKDLITSDIILESVHKRMQDEYQQDVSVTSIKNSLSVNQTQNSQMFSISATTEDPVLSERLANQTTAIFQERAQETLNVDKITVISAAIPNMTPVSPNVKLNLVIGLLGGLMAGILLAVLLEALDRSVKDERFITEELGLPVLGIIPNMTGKELNIHAGNASQYPSLENRDENENEEGLKRRDRTNI